jgi:hypothetical protein
MSTSLLREDTSRSWHSSNGHNTDMLRRQ